MEKEEEVNELRERIDALTKQVNEHNRLLGVAKLWMESIESRIQRMKEIASRYGVNL